MTRKEAKANGALYYEGHPCSRCCGNQRYVKSKACVNCNGKKYAEERKSVHNPRPAFHHALPEKPKREPLFLPSNGAAFPATLARLMAGR